MNESFVLHIKYSFARSLLGNQYFVIWYLLFLFGSSLFVEWREYKDLVIWEQDVSIDEKFYMVNPQMVQIFLVTTTIHNASTQSTQFILCLIA